jgi:hypothetical protein
MFLLLLFLRKQDADMGYIDSTPIKVCHNKRIFNHKVFKGLAARGNSTMGWLFGSKFHIAVYPVPKRMPSRRLGAQALSRTGRTAQAEHRIDELGILRG